MHPRVGFLSALTFSLMLTACPRNDNHVGTMSPDSGGGAGGSAGTSGAPGTGGSSGGLLDTGGVLGTGGNNTGGVLGTGGTGGNNTGGVLRTGGSNTGGVPRTGGSNTGGVPGTGGNNTGGVPGTRSTQADSGSDVADSPLASRCDRDLATKALASIGLTTTGIVQDTEVTLPAALTDANWSLKSSACQQGGYDITPLAGQTLCLLGAGIVQRCTDYGDTAWVLMSGGTVRCIYETSKVGLPGVYPVGSSNCCTDGCQSPDGGPAPAVDAGPDIAVAPGCDLRLASQAIAALGLKTVGDAQTLNVTLPTTLSTDANWGLKATICQQGGFNITALAGQTVCLVGQSIPQACAASPDNVWVVMSNGQVKCIYESSRTAGAPGLYPVGGTYCGT